MSSLLLSIIKHVEMLEETSGVTKAMRKATYHSDYVKTKGRNYRSYKAVKMRKMKHGK